MPKKFIVTIEETISENFEVVAETDEKAIEIARTKHREGEFVLSPGKLISKQMCIRDTTDNEVSEWFKF